MKAIVFDVDDTIYDQQVVFDQACRDVFGELKGVSLVDLFKANRIIVMRVLMPWGGVK